MGLGGQNLSSVSPSVSISTVHATLSLPDCWLASAQGGAMQACCCEEGL